MKGAQTQADNDMVVKMRPVSSGCMPFFRVRAGSKGAMAYFPARLNIMEKASDIITKYCWCVHRDGFRFVSSLDTFSHELGHALLIVQFALSTVQQPQLGGLATI